MHWVFVALPNGRTLRWTLPKTRCTIWLRLRVFCYTLKRDVPVPQSQVCVMIFFFRLKIRMNVYKWCRTCLITTGFENLGHINSTLQVCSQIKCPQEWQQMHLKSPIDARLLDLAHPIFHCRLDSFPGILFFLFFSITRKAISCGASILLCVYVSHMIHTYRSSHEKEMFV